MKLTRRQLVTATAGAAVAAQVRAQTAAAPNPTPSPAGDASKGALDSVRRNADTLAKFEIPISTEPAFQFKA